MLIGNKLIKKYLDNGQLRAWKGTDESLSESELKIGTNSIDVTLGSVIYITRPMPVYMYYEDEGRGLSIDGTHSTIDLSKPFPKDIYQSSTIPDIGYVLEPNEFILASVNERFDCADLNWVQHYEGRSTMARVGVLSHVSAGFGDYGFNGSFTLEIKNLGHHSVIIYPDMRIGQVYFENVTDCDVTYKGYSQTDCLPALPITGKDRIF